MTSCLSYKRASFRRDQGLGFLLGQVAHKSSNTEQKFQLPRPGESFFEPPFDLRASFQIRRFLFLLVPHYFVSTSFSFKETTRSFRTSILQNLCSRVTCDACVTLVSIRRKFRSSISHKVFRNILFSP